MWKASEIRWPCAALIGIVVAICLRPGGSSWYFDMSRLFDLALHYNSTPSHFLGVSLPFTASPFGLKGTHAMRYGPGCVWIDQIFLAFTHNLIVMTVIRTAAVSGLIAFGLLWLSQLLGVSAWLAVLTMFSPWIWYYSRQLWDISLTIPTTLLVLASYGQFLSTGRAWALCVAVVFGAFTLLLHLIALPFIAVIVLHLVIFRWREAVKCGWPLWVTAAVMLCISLPYLHYALTFHGAAVPPYSSRWKGWVFPLLGAQHVTGWNVGYILEEDAHDIRPAAVRYVFIVARVVTCIGFAACFWGLFVALGHARRALADSAGKGLAIGHLSLIALGVFVVQTVFDGVEHVSLHPHYYNTTWSIYVLFVWLGLDVLPTWLGKENLFARWTVPVYGAALILVLAIVNWQIARNGGSRGDHYNAVLSNQIEVAREIDRFSPTSEIDMEVPYWKQRGETLPVICRIVDPAGGDRPVRRLVVRFRNAFPGDARVVVENYPVSVAGR